MNGILEKQYQVTAYKISVAPELFSSENAKYLKPHKLFMNILNETLVEIQNNLVRISESDLQGLGSLAVTREQVFLTSEEFDELSAQVNAILENYKRPGPEENKTEKKVYGVTIALYPLSRPQKKLKEDSDNE